MRSALLGEPIDQPLAGDGICIAAALVQPLGMPLHGVNGERGVGGGLDDLAAPLHRLKAAAQTVQRLMVGAVDMEVGAVEMVEEGTCGGMDRMDGVDPGCELLVALHVLDQGAAQRHIDQLVAPADAEDGFAGIDKGGGQTEFLFVAGGIDAFAGNVFRAVVLRVDVGAAGQEQTVAGGGGRFQSAVVDDGLGEEKGFFVVGKSPGLAGEKNMREHSHLLKVLFL